jgi:serine acetyltransferase
LFANILLGHRHRIVKVADRTASIRQGVFIGRLASAFASAIQVGYGVYIAAASGIIMFAAFSIKSRSRQAPSGKPS